MNSNNDKTMRGLFRPYTPFEEWDDRSEYRYKYEMDFFRKRNPTVLDILHGINTNRSILHDEKYDEPFEYIEFLYSLFPELKIVKEKWMEWSFGMSTNPDGSFSNCDCCGVNLNFFNTNCNYGMCDCCEELHSNKDKEFTIND